jgi:hypothetical protein
LPERIVRSTLGFSAGVVREVGEVAIPIDIRRGELYRNLVDTTLRFFIEQVGGAEGTYPQADAIAERFLARRTAGNAIEALGVIAFRASPVWVLAALADVCGIGRRVIPEIADALKQEGLLDADVEVATVDQLLDGLERTSARLAATVNTPPLDIATLRAEWQALRQDASLLPAAHLPSREAIGDVWNRLKTESVRQQRSVFETSSLVGLSAVRRLPAGIRWLSASARVGAGRTGQVVATILLDHYRQTLDDIQRVGYVAYGIRQFRPYLRAAVSQFSPARPTLTERLLAKVPRRRTR